MLPKIANHFIYLTTINLNTFLAITYEVEIKQEIDELQHDPISIPYDNASEEQLSNNDTDGEENDTELVKGDPPKEAFCSQQIPTERCRFCLRILNGNIKMQFKPTVENTHIKKMEYVLSIKLKIEPLCCVSCWQMIDLFDGFKRSCYMALFKPEELLGITKTSILPTANGPASEPVPKQAKIIIPVEGKPPQVNSRPKEAPSSAAKSPTFMVSIPLVRTPSPANFLTCKLCSREFPTFKSFISHKKICLGYPCHMCSAVVGTRPELKMHFEKEHAGMMMAKDSLILS